MRPDILSTKLFIPAYPANHVLRPRLTDLLRQLNQPDGRVVVVSAPAGYGKTSLIASWIHAQKCNTAWISLDERDNQIVQFFAYLIAALERIGISIDQATRELLELPNIPVNELALDVLKDCGCFAQPFILVLDDYHLIHEKSIHEVLRHWIQSFPANARIVIISRQDPPFPLARLRASGQLIEIRQADLQFSTQEIVDFFNQVMSLSLSTKELTILEKRTEGWIAGLQMAALALQTSRDREQFFRDFSGTHRFILDYLIEEVLAKQSESTQKFLSHTSVLRQFNADLCAALLQEEQFSAAGCQAMLEKIERTNLFIIPLDETRQWYRYHHLFSDLLVARLKFQAPQVWTELNRRASAWYDDHQESKLALDHALAAHDFEYAADLIEKYVVTHWRVTDLTFFMAVKQLPDELLSRRPGLCLQNAWIGVITGQLDLTRRMLDMTDASLASLQQKESARLAPEERGMLAFSRVLWAYLDDMDNQHVQVDPTFKNAILSVPEENVGMRNSIAVVIGSIFFMEGEFKQAVDFFRDAIDRDIANNGTNAIPIAASRWARVWVVEGKLRAAHDLCAQYEAYVRERDIRRYYVAGNLLILRAGILRSWGQYDLAEKLVNEGLALHRNWPVPQGVFIGLVTLAHIHLNRSNWEECAACLEQAKQMTLTIQIHPEFMAYYQSVLVRLWCAQGNTPALQQYLNQCEEGDDSFRFESRRLSQVRALIALERKKEAVEILTRVAAHAQAAGRSGHRIEALTLLTACQPEDQALASLEAALQLAQPEGYVVLFAEAGEAVANRLVELQHRLRQQTESHSLAAYARSLLEFIQSGQPASPAPPTKIETSLTASLVEPLTPREIEVLRLTAEGLSNQEIANQLFISIRTVKKHLQNAYSKLDAKGRVQAINRARELQLF
ncbi:LuxR C-terminal-related transcriptional regulator [Ornatilinea apprima]|nr:LuxR C-terminal-related transcriptional regulator [Ornatilinea apprima]